MGKHKFLLLGYFLALTALFTVVLVAPWNPEQITEEAKGVDQLFYLLMITGIIITAIVMTLVIYAVTHFRAHPDDVERTEDGAPIHGHHKLELFWTIVPAIIVTAISFVSYVILTENEDEAKAETAMQVKVIGKQFTWDYEYLDEGIQVAGPNALVLPVDRTVTFQITAPDGDVIHSFWVPEARLKRDAVPGIITDLQWTSTKEGEWEVVCAELCGGGHASMRGPIRVVSQAEYDDWVAEQRAASQEESDTASDTEESPVAEEEAGQ